MLGQAPRPLSFLALFAATAEIVDAEWTFSGLAGASFTPASDVTLHEPGLRAVVLESIPWAGESFASPPYYALRVTRFFDSGPRWGIALDVTHAHGDRRARRDGARRLHQRHVRRIPGAVAAPSGLLQGAELSHR